eukprot:CAMPEP_0183349290 /NCGR_PEP_ID=MMETSP0164_2-20130417/13519_1 /TAXON_ID=221442 /ORGANISM="Coccolithus pelagicus ssp braarudi, Strain PLY182g" /LENGTH=102 /DNA_ID=CAMNT_0025520987 /DNA_START=157 /DNA_END=468 /DNA_ORIENTATION=+
MHGNGGSVHCVKPAPEFLGAEVAEGGDHEWDEAPVGRLAPQAVLVHLVLGPVRENAAPEDSAGPAYAGRRGHATVQSIILSDGLWLQLVMRAFFQVGCGSSW